MTSLFFVHRIINCPTNKKKICKTSFIIVNMDKEIQLITYIFKKYMFGILCCKEYLIAEILKTSFINLIYMINKILN